MIEPARFERRLPEEWTRVPWNEDPDNRPSAKEAAKWLAVALLFVLWVSYALATSTKVYAAEHAVSRCESTIVSMLNGRVDIDGKPHQVLVLGETQ